MLFAKTRSSLHCSPGHRQSNNRSFEFAKKCHVLFLEQEPPFGQYFVRFCPSTQNSFLFKNAQHQVKSQKHVNLNII